MQAKYTTSRGVCYQGLAEELLIGEPTKALSHQVSLIFTSPPFPLNRKKKYGNRGGQEFVDWLASFAPIFRNLLKPDGSVVIELGNTWDKGQPIVSTLGLRALLSFLDMGQFKLCQQFVWYNPAKLPSPAQWVNVERIRVKDSFTHLWWMAPNERPKANNRNVLTEYSESMQKLLATKKYNFGRRPSEHNVGKESFLKDNAGAIPSNVLVQSNTKANSPYFKHCREHGIPVHPARMPIQVPEFFIKLLTDENDIVLDPFAGSNTTGIASEKLGRRWVAVEPNELYIEGSKGHFMDFLVTAQATLI